MFLAPTKDEARARIATLVANFERQLPDYHRGNYNETQTRVDFIDPFFQALGWDIYNSHGAAEAYREVIHEDKVKVGKATKAPDYSFRLSGGQRLFFVEAKKPSVKIKDEVLPAYQVRGGGGAENGPGWRGLFVVFRGKRSQVLRERDFKFGERGGVIGIRRALPARMQ